MGIEWPQPYRALSSMFLAFNFNFFELVVPVKCFMSNTQDHTFYSSLLTKTLSPILVILLFWLALLIQNASVLCLPLGCVERLNAHFADGYAITSNYALYGTIMVMYLILPSVSLTIFNVFICTPLPAIDGEEPEEWLTEDLTLNCSLDSPIRVGWVVYTCLMILVYPVGIPAVFYLLLSNPRTLQEVRDPKRNEHNSGRLSVLKPLYDSYKPDHFRAEIGISLWRILMCGMIVFMVSFTKNYEPQP